MSGGDHENPAEDDHASEENDEVELLVPTPPTIGKNRDQKLFSNSEIKKPKGLATLAIPDEDSGDDDDGGFKLPPSRTEHKKKFGERILGEFGSDSEDRPEHISERQRKDEEAPKPTVDVLMSRNLRSGAGKGFNFGGLVGDSSSDEKEQEEAQASEEEEKKEPTTKRSNAKIGTKYYSSGLQSGLKLSLGKNDNTTKFDEEEDVIRKPPPKKGNRLQLQIDPDIQNNRLAGTTGATDDVEDQPQSKKAKKPFSIKPAGLKLDTDKINDMFTFGGEKGDMREEHANEKLEEDIQELALICVEAMRNYQKKKDAEMDLAEDDFLIN